MSKKKWISLALAGVMALSLVACGGGKTEESKAPEASKAPEGQATTSAWGIERGAGVPADYPSKEITWINPFSAGSAMENCVRIAGTIIRENEGWSKSIVINNVEGASGAIGWQQGADADPDGYTMFFYPTAACITNLAIQGSFAPSQVEVVCNIMSDPGVIACHPDAEWNDLADLCEAAKANPGAISIGVTSVNGSEGLALKQIMDASGAQFNVIPFDGETAVATAVAGKHCDALCLNVGDILNFVEDGSIKVLATGNEKRDDRMPDAPTYKECGVDVIQLNCRGMAVPKGTDPDVIKYLSDCFEKAAATDEYMEQTAQMQIPYDFMNRETMKTLFDGFEESYNALYEKDPW